MTAEEISKKLLWMPPEVKSVKLHPHTIPWLEYYFASCHPWHLEREPKIKMYGFEILPDWSVGEYDVIAVE